MLKIITDNLIIDLQLKLNLYNNTKEDKIVNLDIPRYENYVNILINKNNLDLDYMINRLENYYKDGVSIENGRLKFYQSEISLIYGKLYKELYFIDSNSAFDKFIDIIQTKVYKGLDFFIYFDEREIKNHFLNKATDYIIKHQQKTWIEEFEKIDHDKHSWLPYIDTKNIPKDFDSFEELYFWFKNTQRASEILYFIGDSLVLELLYIIINNEDYNLYNKANNNIIKILDNCKEDYILIATILTTTNIGLNCFLLTDFRYAIYGFCNLYNIDSKPHNLIDEDIDYTKQWEELISKQLVNIYFKHFYNLQYKDDFSKNIFYILNYFTKQYIHQFNNPMHYKANYTLQLVMKKLVDMEIEVSRYEKKTLFELIQNDLLSMQIEKLDKFDEQNFFLFSFYLNHTQNIELLNNSVDDIFEALKNTFAKQEHDFYVNFSFLEKIDFSVFYKYTQDKDIWCHNLIDLYRIEKEWKRINNERSNKKVLSSKDERVPKEIVKLCFYILLDIYKKYNDKHIAQQINKIAIKFGIEYDFGIFLDYSFEKSFLFDRYLEIVNLFDDELFDHLLDSLVNKSKLKELLQLYNYTIIDSRQKQIKDAINNIKNNLTKENVSYFDIREAITYATYNNFDELATVLISMYQDKIESTNYKHKEKDFLEIVCKKELLDIYYNKELSKDKKIYLLNDYKIPFDDGNWGDESKQLKCEQYRSFVRAIILFNENKAKEAYHILLNLVDKELNSLYLINMLNAYFKIYENDINKKEYFQTILEKYEKYAKKLPNYTKSLFEYQTLLYGYLISGNEEKFLQLWHEMPKYYKYDFNIFEIRCQFLQKYKQTFKAKEYIKEFKKSQKDETILKNIEEIEKQIDKDIEIEVKNKYNILISSPNKLSLTLEEGKNYWLQIKDMTDEEHSQIFSKSNNLEDFIKNIMLDISKELLNRKVNLQRQTNNKQTLELEDIINDWVTSLIEQKMDFLNWYVKDQTRGGTSSSAKSPGEKDLEVYSKNQKLFLFEAFRLFGNDTSVIKEHIDKLDGYNADGCQTMVVMVYTYVDDFVNLCNNYKNLLESMDYKGFDKNNKSEFKPLNGGTNIKIFQEFRYKNGTKINLYHFLLDFK